MLPKGPIIATDLYNYQSDVGLTISLVKSIILSKGANIATDLYHCQSDVA